MAKKIKVKELFAQRQMTVQDLIEDLKSEPFGKGTKEEIKIKQRDLQALIDRFIIPLQKEIKEFGKKLDKEKLPFEKLRIANEIEYRKEKIERLDIGWQKNEIRRLQGKDYYYSVDTSFGVHKVYRSQIEKEDSNKIFLNIMKSDVEKAIKKYEKSKDPKDIKRVKILKERLMPVIQFNLEVDGVRNMDINQLSASMRSDIERASDPDIEKEEKGGKYPIQVIVTGNVIQLV